MTNKELYAKAFTYPSQEEWKEIIDSFLIVKELAFKGSNSVKDNLFSDEMDMFIAKKDIPAWINNNVFERNNQP